jgi:hypothetical protein
VVSDAAKHRNPTLCDGDDDRETLLQCQGCTSGAHTLCLGLSEKAAAAALKAGSDRFSPPFSCSRRTCTLPGLLK